VDTIVAGGWVLTMNPGREVYRAGAIAIRDGLIVEVGQRADILARYTPTRLIDAPDGVIIPGMVNGHRHLLCCAKGAMPEGGQTLNALRSFIYPSFAAITEDDMHVFARHAAAEMIRFGTTLFEEPGCNHLDAVLEALAESGIRARTGPWTWDQAGPTGDTDLPGWLRFDAKTALRRLEDGIETVRKFGNPRIKDAVTIEGVGTASDELTRGAAELALEAQSLFVLHKSTSEREVELELAAYGERPVAHMAAIGALNERTLLNHMTSLDDNDVALVAAAGVRISQNPSSALKLAKGTTRTGKWPELLAAGVPMALGTDAENVSNHTDICRAMQLAALLPRDARRDPRAVTAEQAVEMATIGGATALLLHNDVGSLEPGKQADLVVFDTSDFDWRPLHNPVANLVYGSTGHSVDTVLIGGDVVLAGKKLTTLDEDQLREDVERVNRRILAEIGIDPTPAWPVLLAGRVGEGVPEHQLVGLEQLRVAGRVAGRGTGGDGGSGEGLQFGGGGGEEVEERGGLAVQVVLGPHGGRDRGAVGTPGREVRAHRDDHIRGLGVGGQPRDERGVRLTAGLRLVRRQRRRIEATSRGERGELPDGESLAAGQHGEELPRVRLRRPGRQRQEGTPVAGHDMRLLGRDAGEHRARRLAGNDQRHQPVVRLAGLEGVPYRGQQISH
jgi:cytosine/adenosine deaminase-related metal-dependent hydrolase